MSLQVVTRFPPSPTGALHLGGARTALFNFLFARHHGGKFKFRLEDTDRERSKKEWEDQIIEALTWLELKWDDQKYRQSERTAIYREYADRLLESDRAYWCHCSPELLEQKKQTAIKQGRKWIYDGTCREMGLGPGPGAVIRLKTPQTGSTGFTDLVKGNIRFENSELDDLILWRSDDTPTYHLAVVVDDVTMGVTHVIRGDDHVNNTPRQMLILEALGEPAPAYAHVPMILGPDGAKLSKRHGALSVLEYRQRGICKEALINYLARLGWSHKDQEIFSKEELIELFTLESVGQAAARFDIEKLNWLNHQWNTKKNMHSPLVFDKRAPHIKVHEGKIDITSSPGLGITYIDGASHASASAALIEFKEGTDRKDTWDWMPDTASAYLAAALEGLKTRSRDLIEQDKLVAPFFKKDENIEYDTKAAKKFLKADALPIFKDLIKRLEQAPDFEETTLEAIFNDVAASRSLKLGQVAQPVRVALTGGTVSQGIYEVMAIMGRERVLSRLRRAVVFIEAPGS
ncbi:MAG: glutamate--tRNA ligase [Proteobacteria bacterium]|nr:glutamate--tRNA ligase [Pseudomonadota bacterium]